MTPATDRYNPAVCEYHERELSEVKRAQEKHEDKVEIIMREVKRDISNLQSFQWKLIGIGIGSAGLMSFLGALAGLALFK